jgi:hypothetical protein
MQTAATKGMTMTDCAFPRDGKDRQSAVAMSNATKAEFPGFAFRARDIVLGILLLWFAAAVIGVASFFRLSSEAAALRESVMAGNENWSRKIALNVGLFTTGLARAGSRFIKMPPEPRAAFDSIRGAEVGIYKLDGSAGWVNPHAILARADKAMTARRWDRVVGVSHEHELVAVYVPQRGFSSTKMKCCVMVLHDRDLVIAGVSGNLEPLFELAQRKVDLKEVTRNFAVRL